MPRFAAARPAPAPSPFGRDDDGNCSLAPCKRPTSSETTGTSARTLANRLGIVTRIFDPGANFRFGVKDAVRHSPAGDTVSSSSAPSCAFGPASVPSPTKADSNARNATAQYLSALSYPATSILRRRGEESRRGEDSRRCNGALLVAPAESGAIGAALSAAIWLGVSVVRRAALRAEALRVSVKLPCSSLSILYLSSIMSTIRCLASWFRSAFPEDSSSSVDMRESRGGPSSSPIPNTLHARPSSGSRGTPHPE